MATPNINNNMEPDYGGRKTKKSRQSKEEEQILNELKEKEKKKQEARSIFAKLNTHHESFNEQTGKLEIDDILDEKDNLSSNLLNDLQTLIGRTLTESNFVNAALRIPNFIEKVKTAIEADKKEKILLKEQRRIIEERAANLPMYDSYEEAVNALRQQTNDYYITGKYEDEVAYRDKKTNEVHVLYCQWTTDNGQDWDRHFYVDSTVHYVKHNNDEGAN